LHEGASTQLDDPGVKPGRSPLGDRHGPQQTLCLKTECLLRVALRAEPSLGDGEAVEVPIYPSFRIVKDFGLDPG
jgi:hypothetical protein